MSKTVLAHPHFRGICLLPSGEEISRTEAMQKGYKITTAPSAAAAIALGYQGEAAGLFASEMERATRVVVMAEADYRRAVMSLSEAQERPIAAAKMAAAHNAQTMPLERAAAFLRGLPSERANLEGDAPANAGAVPAVTEASLRRRVEIALACAPLKASAQTFEAKQRYANLRYAIQLNDAGRPMLDALKSVGVNPDTLA